MLCFAFDKLISFYLSLYSFPTLFIFIRFYNVLILVFLVFVSSPPFITVACFNFFSYYYILLSSLINDLFWLYSFYVSCLTLAILSSYVSIYYLAYFIYCEHVFLLYWSFSIFVRIYGILNYINYLFIIDCYRSTNWSNSIYYNFMCNVYIFFIVTAFFIKASYSYFSILLLILTLF